LLQLERSTVDHSLREWKRKAKGLHAAWAAGAYLIDPVTRTQTQTASPRRAEARPEAVDLTGDVSVGKRKEHLDANTLETMLTSLLALYPQAPVCALRPDGVVVAMPGSIPLRRNPVLEARSGLDLVVPEENVKVLTIWDEVLGGGSGRCLLHLVSDPDTTVMFHWLDLREIHGVILALICPADTADGPKPDAREIPEVAPRFATIHKDEHSFMIGIDTAVTQILGWSAEDMKGRRSIEFIHPDDHALAIDNWMEMLSSPGPGRRVRLRHRRRDGSWAWFEITNHNLLDDPDQRCVVAELVDISEEMAAQLLLERLARAVPVGLFQLDAGRRIVYTNERLHEILGVERADTVEEQLASVIDTDRTALDRAVDKVLGEGLQADIEVELRLPLSHELRFCTISLRALSEDDGTVDGAIACVADITDSARMREELHKRATFDELTGCHNRASIMGALEADIASGQRQAERAVVFVDLDGFKAVNDRHGHATGDELLDIVAQRLKGALRDEDIIGRIGGDEFLAVCPNIGGPDQAMKLAGRLAEAQSEEVPVAKGTIKVLVSIGVAWSSGEGTDADSMVAQADGAMYESKRDGLGRPRLANAAEA
jgi:diguanylate cyclase (GGDEF)-like protein/PAS domain S-box-containing protein